MPAAPVLQKPADSDTLARLAATAAHQIRNPLASILAAIENLRDELELRGDHADRVREIIETIHRLDDIVERLLLLGRAWTPSPKRYDLAQLVARLLESARRAPGSDRIAFDVRAPERIPITGDHTMIEHALSNVILNAIEAMPEGGTLCLQIEVSGPDVQVVVEDTGVGIPPEIEASLFQPFFTTKARGTGLGLATARKLLEAHRGDIRLESRPGVGTRAILRFPIFLG